MSKYSTVFSISWQNEFVYRLNFILWRIRNILRLLMTYFLWSGVFTTNAVVYGYSQPQMVTYIFLVLLVQTLIISAPSADHIGSEIGNGDISNYLVKPINYLKYWFTRDLASKLLNISFAVGEAVILWLILRPTLSVSLTFWSTVAFLISAALAVVSYFLLSCATRFVSFWTPQNTWGFAFLVLVLLEILAGGIFPLDILPTGARIAVQFTPFPYLVYYPIAIFLGKVSGWETVRILAQSTIWLVILLHTTRWVWRKGLVAYAAEGR